MTTPAILSAPVKARRLIATAGIDPRHGADEIPIARAI
jgi:hypothetical protein